MKVFDNLYFAQQLAETVPLGFVAIHVSFVIGWEGNDQQKAATMTSCWIETKLSRPLRWLDKVMAKMGKPK